MPPDEPASSGPTRSLPRLLMVVVATLLVARVATGLYERAHPRATVDLVKWTPVATAEAQSRGTRLPILYEFGAEWCGPCRLMGREVFADRRAAETINSLFVPVRLTDRQREDGRNPPDVAALQERYRIGAFPSLVIVPLDGSAPTVIEGYPGKAALIQQLTKAGVKARFQRGLGR